MIMTNLTTETTNLLVLGATGKTGRRVLARLRHRRGLRLRSGSRTATPGFDWTDRSGWPAVLDGIDTVYLCYAVDIAMPSAGPDIAAFCRAAADAGVRRIVMLSGRGEPGAQACEQLVQASVPEWTILRCSWFMQNFSEYFLLDPIRDGEVALPVADVPEPFVDLEDVAEIAARALTTDDHLGRSYELTGPRSITFADAVAEISRSVRRVINYRRVPLPDYLQTLASFGVPDDELGLYGYLFSDILDGRNSAATDDVRQALGRTAGSFGDFVTRTAATGVWQPSTQQSTQSTEQP
jgi:uncharacterized protein YbjT (DUF2867 family)